MYRAGTTGCGIASAPGGCRWSGKGCRTQRLETPAGAPTLLGPPSSFGLADKAKPYGHKKSAQDGKIPSAMSSWVRQELVAPPVSEPSVAILVGGAFPVTVSVSATPEAQFVRIRAPRESRLVLHWGLEGGKDYAGQGWRLPSALSWPRGTVQYKDRALQTAFKAASGEDWCEVEICLKGDDMADRLNFVFKEEVTGLWHDYHGSNFVVGLDPLDPLAAPSLDGFEGHPAPPASLPDDLCGLWTYKKWEQAGFPFRSEDESGFYYRAAVQEIKSHLSKGNSMEEVWELARSGEFL
eukprot:CAMPEP_0117674282 /NCGR_PEP_ID=MMETSP0804-20121206/14949_1 /TAXON_ID=1074897 /ORGANISM="Tetraselmis astigmatica, Strain CCMP880" /LENGTH=294 /DNA_ID=CAMNT_0005483129 /DNA_START=65 /DNA_END=949 /DNA_ORIENTATION=+